MIDKFKFYQFILIILIIILFTILTLYDTLCNIYSFLITDVQLYCNNGEYFYNITYTFLKLLNNH